MQPSVCQKLQLPLKLLGATLVSAGVPALQVMRYCSVDTYWEFSAVNPGRLISITSRLFFLIFTGRSMVTALSPETGIRPLRQPV